MNRAYRALAAFLLAIGLAACSGNATTSASGSGASAATTAATTYRNTDFGFSYTPPEGFAVSESSDSNVVYLAKDADSNNVNIRISALSEGEDFADVEYLNTLGEFTISALGSDIENGSFETTTFKTSDGSSLTGILVSGNLKGENILVEQVYIQKGSEAAMITATCREGVDPETVLAGLTLDK